MHVVITGASSGIGEALAHEYLRRGAKVTLVARRLDRLEKIAEGRAEACHLVRADLAEPEPTFDWLAGAERAHGPIDVLVNNAGVQIVAPFVATPIADAERLFRVDALTPFRLTQRVLPAMLARGSGCIVDVASLAAIAPTPGMVFYNAAKAALAALSESLRGELRGTGVHVVTVYPGPVSTDMERAARDAYGDTAAARAVPTGRTDVLARRIADAVTHRRARVIYPRVYALTRHFPNVTRFLLDRLTPRTRAAAALPPAP